MSQLIAIANERYVALPKLDNAEYCINELGKILREKHGFEASVLPSLERGPLLEAIDEKLAKKVLDGDVLMLVWIGHGELGVDKTLRLLGHTAKDDVQVATAANLGEWAARTGARQVLLVIDTCHSGGGVLDAVRLSQAVDAGKLEPGNAWFGVLAASLADEPALSGALVRKLTQILRAGPETGDFRWDKSRPFIRGDDLIQTVVAEWDETRQQPVPISAGRAWDFVRNPFFQAGIPDQPVEHLLQAARGTHGDLNFFTGREAPLSEIVAWMRAGGPGMFVLTGSPGCGKSAIAGRIASLSSPAERGRILAQGEVASVVDPGENSVDVQLHARGLTLELTSEILAMQTAQDAGGGQYAVLAEARRRHKAGDPMVFIIDGLDEAHNYSHEIATEFLVPLSRDALVLVATRNISYANGSLIQDLGPAAHVLDLDADAEGTRSDVREYVKRRLVGVDERMDPEIVAEQFGQEQSGLAPFLLARLVTSQLRESPVDTSVPDWEMRLASSVESAFERDLQRAVLVIDGNPHPTAARELTRALALAYGAGFPADDVWPEVASAISPTGTVYTRDDVFALLGMLSRQIIASSESSLPVYRVAHQRLVDYLNTRQLAPELRVAMAKAIFELYTELLDAGFTPQTNTYLWRYAWRHFADAGEAGLVYLRKLVERDRKAFLPDLALTLDHCSRVAILHGAVEEAITGAKECVGIRRQLNEPLSLSLSLFKLAMYEMVANNEEGADAASDEAIRLARESADSPERRAALTRALIARAMTHIRAGNPTMGNLLAKEAITLQENSVSDNDENSFDMAWVNFVAGQAAMATGDLDSALRYFSKAIHFLESRPQDTGNIELRVSVLASSAAAELRQALTNAGKSDLRISVPSGELLVREYREKGPRHALPDIDLARGLAAAISGRRLDQLRMGLAEASSQELNELMEATIAMVEPFAAKSIDAAVTLAVALDQRAELTSATAPEDAARDRAESERALRRLAGDSSVAALALGEILLRRISSEFQTALNHGLDCPSLLERQAEVVALLRKSNISASRMLLAEALVGHCAISSLTSAPIQQQISLRAEAIALLRDYSSSSRYAIQLACLLVDQGAQLAYFSPVEAADLAREAMTLADSLGSTGDFIGALARVNLAASQWTIGNPVENRQLLNEAIAQLTSQPPSPARDGTLAMAKSNLALLEMEADELPQALEHGLEAVALIENRKLPGTLVDDRMAYLILGSAQRRNGQIEAGNRTVHRMLDELRKEVAVGRAGLDRLALALNIVGANDLWEEALRAVEQDPKAQRELSLMRLRSRTEIREAVHDLLGRLPSATNEEISLIHRVARLQRSRAPSEFDEEWSKQSGKLPAWLNLKPAHEFLVIAWMNIPNSQSSRDYLFAHPELLNPETNIAFEEMVLAGAQLDLIGVCRDILYTAAEKGIEAAYTRILANDDLQAWIHSDNCEQYLEEHPDLMRPEVAEFLGEKVNAGDVVAEAIGAMLELARRGERKLACQGLREPDSLVVYFQPALESGDVKRLAALATVVRGAADLDSVRRQAAAMLAIAHILDGQPGDELMQGALKECPAEEREAFAVMVGEAIANYPRSGAALARLLQ